MAIIRPFWCAHSWEKCFGLLSPDFKRKQRRKTKNTACRRTNTRNCRVREVIQNGLSFQESTSPAKKKIIFFDILTRPKDHEKNVQSLNCIFYYQIFDPQKFKGWPLAESAYKIKASQPKLSEDDHRLGLVKGWQPPHGSSIYKANEQRRKNGCLG